MAHGGLAAWARHLTLDTTIFFDAFLSGIGSSRITRLRPPRTVQAMVIIAAKKTIGIRSWLIFLPPNVSRSIVAPTCSHSRLIFAQPGVAGLKAYRSTRHKICEAPPRRSRAINFRGAPRGGRPPSKSPRDQTNIKLIDHVRAAITSAASSNRGSATIDSVITRPRAGHRSVAPTTTKQQITLAGNQVI